MRIGIIRISALIAAGVLVASLIPAVIGGDGSTNSNQNQGDLQGGGGAGEETAGNCLSFPVIWAEGVDKILRGTYTVVETDGTWWYWWGIDKSDEEELVPLSCLPDPINDELCNSSDSVEIEPGCTELQLNDPDNYTCEVVRQVWVQQDENNTWQAQSVNWSDAPVNVHWIDWGDSIESVDWNTNSKVRAEVVLYQNVTEDQTHQTEYPMLEYQMYHVDGWGIDEMWGISKDGETAVVGPGTKATVFTPCARLTIQKLLVDRENVSPDDLIWVPGEGWTESNPNSETNLINTSIFNAAVHEAVAEGSGEFPAEINVKGKIMFGYTWDVRSLNDEINDGEASGDYRLTFSLDETCDGIAADGTPYTAERNTFFVDGVTDFLENETGIYGGEETGGDPQGALAVIDYENNLTYIDIRIEPK